jgi:hypothetical protein
MRVDIWRTSDGFQYRLELQDGDRSAGLREFTGVDHEELRLVRSEWEVRLPAAFVDLHPDVHATAVWTVLWPFVGHRLELPFGVSAWFAEKMAHWYGVTVTPVDPGRSRRECPPDYRPSLLFSGGVDSLAAAMFLPSSTAILFMDRIPHFPGQSAEDSNALIDLVHQRSICDALEADGYPVFRVADDHEFLFEPYPVWHSSVYTLPALYMADSLKLGVVETGDVLCIKYFGGYLDSRNEVTKWRFTPDSHSRAERATEPEDPFWGVSDTRQAPDLSQAGARAFATLSLVGMGKVSSTFGLSEVATARIVFDSPYRAQGASCYYRSDTNYCMRCDKCFKKILLDRIFEDVEVDPSFIDSFLRYPQVGGIFRGPFLQWHHIWYYIFQKLRCAHPWVQELRRQTEGGPDLTLLEKWYPGAAGQIPPVYRREVLASLRRSPGVMSEEEVLRLEKLDIPPLMPPGHGFAGGVEGRASSEGCGAFGRAVQIALQAAVDRKGGSFEGWTLGRMELSSAVSEGLRFPFLKDASRFVVEVSPLAPEHRYYVATAGHGLSHPKDCPPESRETRLLMGIVKWAVERAEERLRA